MSVKLENKATTLSGIVLEANRYGDQFFSVERSGYVPIALGGFQFEGTGSSFLIPSCMSLSGNQVHAVMRNIGTSTTNATLTVNVLYKKTA